jgi:threonine/homoserine/homoserine lactone efflux protein
MLESLITISLVGLIAGFILSMPIAGPISILITSNALKGRKKYCILATIGASFADFFYVFIAVFGLTKLFTYYKPFIPYLLSAGAIFLIYIGFKIFRTRIDIEHLDDTSHLTEKIKKKERGGFYTGFMLNFLNPTLFLGWLASSFIIISFVSSMGFNTGGLDTMINQNVKEFNTIEGKPTEKQQIPSYLQFKNADAKKIETYKQECKTYPKYFPLLISLCYAFFLSVGSIIWFYYLTLFLVRFHQRINVNIVNVIINGLGIVLCLFGIFFGYNAIKMFLK